MSQGRRLLWLNSCRHSRARTSPRAPTRGGNPVSETGLLSLIRRTA